jgi:hypothetical protein
LKPFRLSRRTLLRGLGAAVALPALEAMLNSHGTAWADGQPIPRRLCTWFFGNGVVLNRWTPAATGGSWQLSEALQPLQPVKDYVTVVSGCNVKTPNLRGHHNGVAALMSGYPFIPLPPGTASYSSKFGGPSIDQVAADIIGAGSTFPSIQVAVSKRVTKGEGPTLQYISHKGPDAPLPPDFSPAALYNRLFGSFEPKDPLDPTDAMRVNVLDAVKQDAARLHKKLGSSDRARLDAHLTSLSEVRGQILALPPVYTSACVKPEPVTQTNVDSGGVEPMEAVAKAMSDLIALAWACDLTRVASFQFSGSVGHSAYPMVGVGDNHHTISHETSRLDDLHTCAVFFVKNFSYLLQKLKALPEGQGNVLDNSVLLMTSDVSEGWTHSITDYPILVAGRGGGMLRYPGIHYRASGRNTSDVLLSVMQAAGTGVTSVGGSEGLSTTPCTQIYA